MLVRKNYYYHSLFACCGALCLQNIQNPVLLGVADAGVMKVIQRQNTILWVRTNGDLCVR